METINTRTAWRPVLRPIAGFLIAALLLQPLSVFTQDGASPAAQAQLRRLAQWQQRIEQGKIEKAQAAQPQGERVSERTSRNLTRVHQLLRGIKARAPAGSKRRSTKDALIAEQARQEEQEQLGELLTAIDADTDAVLADFAAQRQQLLTQRVSAEILLRHDQTQTELGQRASELRGLIRQWRQAPGPATLAALDAYFERYPATRASAPVDPAKLPWSPPKPNERAPAESKQAWWQNLYRDQAVKLAQAGGASTGIQFSIPPEPGQAPAAADLAETPEVTLTAEIRAKAQELKSNPVAIHNWVRNNIEWVPSWGAIQSAQDTLDKKRGNAIDIASLQIALLRAAGIPARYQFGTVDIPATQAMNWTGNTDNARAALQVMTQGGIAARGRTQGGQIQTIRFEHAWVQAYVNWSPGRGSRNATPTQHVNPNAALNAWVALDASVKQYQYAPGMDLQSAVPLDAQALLNAGKVGATVNEQQGWVQNVNQAAIQSQIDNYQARIKTYINSQNPITVSEVIDKKIIPKITHSLLAGVPPLAVVQSGLQTAAVPASLQHKFSYTLSDNRGNALLGYTEATSKLVGKRLTLTYTPADQATTDLIASYLPKPHADGSPIQASELPASLPGYLIRLKPRITLDAQVVAQGTSILTMGTDLYSTGGFTELANPTQWDLTKEESNVAGQATVIGISAGGLSLTQLIRLKERLTQANTIMKDTPLTAANSLSSEQVAGDALASVLWSWYAVAESSSRISQAQAQMIEYPGLRYGLFHAVVSPISSWGVIRKVTFPGMSMDIAHVRNITWAKDNNYQKWVNYNKLHGQYMSAMEAAVPKRFYNNPAQCNLTGTETPNPGLPSCPQAISAVRVMAIAANAGQRIFTITPQLYQDNFGIVNSNLMAHSAATGQTVQDALDAGNTVNIHEAPISQDEWTGAGFIVTDPNTGAGGYIIEGVGSGGATKADVDRVFVMLGYAGYVKAPIIGAIFPTTDMASAAISIAYMGLLAVFEYISQAVINFIVTAMVVVALIAVLIAAFILLGPAVVAVIAVLIAALSPAAAHAAQDKGCEAACREHMSRCFGTRLNDRIGGNWNSKRCQLFYDSCIQRNGDWLSRGHTGARCDYWNFE